MDISFSENLPIFGPPARTPQPREHLLLNTRSRGASRASMFGWTRRIRHECSLLSRADSLKFCDKLEMKYATDECDIFNQIIRFAHVLIPSSQQKMPDFPLLHSQDSGLYEIQDPCTKQNETGMLVFNSTAPPGLSLRQRHPSGIEHV